MFPHKKLSKLNPNPFPSMFPNLNVVPLQRSLLRKAQRPRLPPSNSSRALKQITLARSLKAFATAVSRVNDVNRLAQMHPDWLRRLAAGRFIQAFFWRCWQIFTMVIGHMAMENGWTWSIFSGFRYLWIVVIFIDFRYVNLPEGNLNGQYLA